MLLAPEVRTTILCLSIVAAFDILCIIGATRAHHSWIRMILAVIAVPIFLASLFEIWVVFLIVH